MGVVWCVVADTNSRGVYGLAGCSPEVGNSQFVVSKDGFQTEQHFCTVGILPKKKNRESGNSSPGSEMEVLEDDGDDDDDDGPVPVPVPVAQPRACRSNSCESTPTHTHVPKTSSL